MGEVLAWTTALPARPGTTPADVASAARSARKKAAKRLRQAVRAGRPELLHRARKAIKRARYATELVEGTSAKRVKRYKRLQDVLGEHQDCVIAAELLHRLGAATVTEPGRNGFTYGVLWQREQVLAAKARKKAAKLKA
jgi:CHAD domain-containing protein